ncbi:MAG: Cell division protein ftsZ [Candidatus Nomurabacteria bacterium GW2011_GWA1_46_11]|uniref:Cell division protein FtsZ n=1 Tax=Candidatus Nomurabacteria bacterium GW2011_GWA1_46_11 TaxID=1618732 RepID=A0A0G1NN20_9BACT|nr:MAG: Cell division protein ftsZ [Parcubacteria group bacterium GW2011_GWA2_46_10]KKU21732.1 MAG: Cell division protein ftsZ [Candidatus Nomurabacteria bacterium GW2011_GWA1_46_11]
MAKKKTRIRRKQTTIKAAVRRKTSRREKRVFKKTTRKLTGVQSRGRRRIIGRRAKKVALHAVRRSVSKKPVVKIKVLGIGGGGGNAVTRMSRDPIRGVELVAVNTDVQDLESCEARRKIHIGKAITRGMGAGMNPELGQQSAEESREEIEAVLKDTDMIFLTAGMGGGTGTGATPVIADIARDMGILTVAVVTKPFSFEGSARMRIAEEGLTKLRDRVDTLLIIPNDRIFNIIDASTPVFKAFDKIDEILKNSVRGIADMITASGLVNVDFADITAVMKDAGTAVVGVGMAKGKDRAAKAVDEAVNSPLLDSSMDGARGVLFSVSGGRDLKMSEINEAAQIITENVDSGAKIIFGAYQDRRLAKGTIKIILIATGFNSSHQLKDPDRFGLFSMGSNEPLEEREVEEDVEEKGESEEMGEEMSEKPRRIGKRGAEEERKTESEDIWEIPAFLRRRKRR